MTQPGTDSLFTRFRDMVPTGCVPLSGVRLLRYVEPDGSEGIRLIRHWLDGDEALRFTLRGDDRLPAAIGMLLLATLGYAQVDEGAA